MNLMGAEVSEDDLQQLKSSKLKTAKIVTVTLPSGEEIQLKDVELTKQPKPKNVRKQGNNK